MKKILVIEDNQHIRENTTELLELAEYQVITAENGKTGVEKALQELPDLIICDIMMPELDGYGVLMLLQKNTKVKNTPFIFLTAKSERSDMRKGMELGADDYLTKPFDGTELLNAVESRLKRVNLLKQELSPGLEGMKELMQAKNGSSILQSFTTGRNFHTYRKKQIIYNEGNRPIYLFFVQKGKIKTYKTNEDGKEFVVGLYNEGDYLGYVALLEGTNYKEVAEAMEDTEVAQIPKKEFDELINSNREISQRFIKMLAQNISEKEDQLLKLAYSSLRKKVAEALVMLNKKYKAAINMSRENLANIAGTATESVIRTLGDFKSEKLIEIKDGSIILLNEKKLETLIN